MKSYLQKIREKKSLTSFEIEEVMKAIMSGSVTSEDLSAFLLGLREKGHTVEEITGAARVMRQFSIKIKTKHKKILDTCGTGGDKKGTFNISTLVAFVVAGAGVIVAKHGNRSVSSKCGSADILEALGVNLNLDEQALGKCLDEVGIAFLFAQKLHPAMKHAAPVRKALGVETIFNLLGPLTNPAQATHQMVGVYDKSFVEPVANVLKNLGSKRALVVHGSDGLDEITTTGATFISEYDGKEIRSYATSPEEFKMDIAADADLKGGDLPVNAKIAQDILEGKGGAKRDIVLLNAAYALYIVEAVKDIPDGIERAASAIDSRKARQKLNELIEFTHRKFS